MISGVLTELIEIVFTERKGKSIQGDFISSLSSVLDGLVLGNVFYLLVYKTHLPVKLLHSIKSIPCYEGDGLFHYEWDVTGSR